MVIIIILIIVICFYFAGNSEDETSGFEDEISGPIEIRKDSSGTIHIRSIPDQAETSFFELSQKIADSRYTVKARLRFCEDSLVYLPHIVEWFREHGGELPPSILCRDVGPELYMRLGRWYDARRIIDTCIACHAYYPENGTAAIEHLNTYKSTAETAVQFLIENPGYLQRKIYKALEGKVDLDCLKHFTRCSYQIRKEPDGKTNRLYVADQ